MKIVIVNGSPRKNGSTAGILAHIAADLVREDHAVETIHLAEAAVSTCIGCSSCYKTGVCCLKDNGDQISDLLLSADGIIIGSPTYVSNITGLLKNFIDRGHFVIEQLLTGKKIFPVITYENAGGTTALKVLTRLAVYSGGSVAAKALVKTDAGVNPLDNPGIAARIAKETARFDHALRHNKKHRMEYLIHTVVFHVGIKPSVLKKSAKYSGVLKRWQALGLIS